MISPPASLSLSLSYISFKKERHVFSVEVHGLFFTVATDNPTLCRAVVMQRLEESGCEATLGTLLSFCEGLASAKAERGQALAALEGKRERIDQFARMTVRILFTPTFS